jgi:peptidyl-prolyl cis-trans isomerase D
MVLQAMRERLTGIIAIFIFAILIIPFAFVGVNSYFTADAVNSVARVNDVEITANDFSQGFQNYRRRMQSLMGASFEAEQFDQPVVRRQYLDSMIDQQLLRQAAEEAGLSVDDESLAQAIRDIEAFQVDGEFNADVYQSRLLAQGNTPQRFENEMRAQIILGQFPDTIASSAIATDWELQQFVRLQDQERTFKAIVVAAQSAETPQAADEVDEAAIQAWYESHPQLYRSEEQVVIEYLELDAAAMEEDVAPDEDQLRTRFEEQKTRFVTPETRLASHILIEVDSQADEGSIESARQQAEDLAAHARAGEDFAALASEYSQDAGSASQGGDLGWVEPGFMVQAFEDGLYALTKEHPISDPVQTGFGWHVIYLRDLRPAEGMSFEEARDILLTEYHTEQQERKFLEQADRLVDLIYEDPTTLNAAAEVLGLEVHEAGPFGRAGGDGIAGNPAVVNAAFSDLVLQQGGVSDPVDLGENHIVMLRIKQHNPEDLLPLAEVRDSVVASVQRERAMQQAAERADGILQQLQAGSDIAAAAEAQSLEVLAMEAVRRDNKELPAELLTGIFLLQAPENEAPRIATVPMANGYAVVQLEQVVDGVVPDDDPARVQNYRRRIANASANAEAMGFLRMLRKHAQIEVFEDRL